MPTRKLIIYQVRTHPEGIGRFQNACNWRTECQLVADLDGVVVVDCFLDFHLMYIGNFLFQLMQHDDVKKVLTLENWLVVAVSSFWLIELYWQFLETVQLSLVGGPGDIVSVAVPPEEAGSCLWE